MKFYDDEKKFGFIGRPEEMTDVFFHYDNITTPNVKPKFLKTVKDGAVIKMSYRTMNYYGKYKNSIKAIDIQVLP